MHYDGRGVVGGDGASAVSGRMVSGEVEGVIREGGAAIGLYILLVTLRSVSIHAYTWWLLKRGAEEGAGSSTSGQPLSTIEQQTSR
eukprot:170947-Pyramimonas_sp.AAC.1